MVKKKRAVGRPVEIREKTVVATFNVFEFQKEWIAEYALKHGLSASDVVRDILEKHMRKVGGKVQ